MLTKLTALATLSASLIVGAIQQTSVSAQGVPDVILWDQQIGRGASFRTSDKVPDLGQRGFNNRASAIQVTNGQKWRFYEGKNFTGAYVDIGPDEARGNLGRLNNRVSSLKAIR
jgi:Beta/Gamma crystallin